LTTFKKEMQNLAKCLPAIIISKAMAGIESKMSLLLRWLILVSFLCWQLF